MGLVAIKNDTYSTYHTYASQNSTSKTLHIMSTLPPRVKIARKGGNVVRTCGLPYVIVILYVPMLVPILDDDVTYGSG